MTCSGARCPAASRSWKSANADHHQRLAGVDLARDLVGRGQRGRAREDAGAVQPRQQFGRCRATALVQHRIGRVVQVVGGAVAEQRLHQRRREQDDAAGRLLDDGQQFLQISAPIWARVAMRAGMDQSSFFFSVRRVAQASASAIAAQDGRAAQDGGLDRGP